MGRFPAQVSHWESAIGSQLQLLRSQLGLTRLAAGRPLTQVQGQAAVGYLDELRKMARIQAERLEMYGQRLCVAQKFAAAHQRRHWELVLGLAEATKLRWVRSQVAALEPEPGELDELDTYVEHMETVQADVDKAAYISVAANEAVDVWAWRAERVNVRLRIIEREITIVLASAGLREHLPKE